MQSTLQRVGNRANVADMACQPFYKWIQETYTWHVVGLFAALYALGGFPAIVWGGALRIAWVYHITWFVNSASHCWGYQSYNTGVALQLPHTLLFCLKFSYVALPQPFVFAVQQQCSSMCSLFMLFLLAAWLTTLRCAVSLKSTACAVVGDLSRNNWWVAALAFGEGWHNNHHAFEFSARHGLDKWQVDITWLVISAFQKVGLATNVKLPSERQKSRLAYK